MTPSSPELDDTDYRALADFRLSLREFLAFSAEGASAHGLTSQQHQALLAIRAHSGAEAISIGELAKLLLIKNHSAIGLLRRLETHGFAKRLESQRDRRRVLIALTPLGSQTVEAISLRNLGQLKRLSNILDTLMRARRKLGPG